MKQIEESEITGKFALFNSGFRPFFLGAALFAILSTLMWMLVYVFSWNIRFNSHLPVIWHAHEMIYGYSLAVIAGFLLTAVGNWTNHQTLHGIPLFLLFALWLSARVISFFAGSVSIEFHAVVDNLFIAFLLISTAVPVFKARQWANIGVVSLLCLFLVSNIIFYRGMLTGDLERVYVGLYAGFYLVLALIFIMGRRVIPFFIEKGVGYPVVLKNWKWLDISSLLLFLVFCIADMFSPEKLTVTLAAGVLFILHTIRMIAWYTPGIWKKPLLWVLYLAYAALLTGFALKVMVYVFNLSASLSLHAFAVGGIGMMTLGMMSRVALGHSGRSVFDPPKSLFWVFALLLLGVVIRVLVPIVDQTHYLLWIGLSQGLWILSYSLFLTIYFPILTQSRIDGRFG